MTRLIDNTISKDTTYLLFRGIHEKKFNGWYKIGTSRDKKYYLSIGDQFGIEYQRNKVYFFNLGNNTKYRVGNIEYATLDGIQFFVRVVLQDDVPDVFIPIR